MECPTAQYNSTHMKQAPTIIIIHGKSEMNQALKYQQHNNKVQFITTDIDSIIFCRRHHIHHTPLFQIVTPTGYSHLDPRFPYHLVTRFLAHPQIKKQLQLPGLDLTIPLTEMMRFEVATLLSNYYYLEELYRLMPFSTLVASSTFFLPQTITIFCKKYSIQYLPLTVSGNKITRVLNLLKPNLILINHARLALQALLHPPAKTPADSQKSSILIFSNGMNLASYASAIKALEDQTTVQIVTGKQSLLDRFYINKYGLKTAQIDFHDSVIQKRFKKLKVQLSKREKNLHFPHTPVIKIIPYTHLSSHGISQLLAQITKNVISSWLNKFLLHYAAAETLINQYHPRLVITTHDPGPTGVAFTLASKKRHLVSAVFMHGAPSSVHFFFADKQVIWGLKMQQQLIQEGIDKNRLILGGHPIYSIYEKYFKTHPYRQSSHVNIGIITSGFGQTELHQVEFFINLFTQLSQLKFPFILNIRSHQTQQLKNLFDLSKEYRVKINLNPPQLLEEFVGDQDVIITQDSTAALVPLIAGIPTILFPLTYPFADNALFVSSKIFYRPSMLKLGECISECLKSNKKALDYTKQKLFLKQYCGPIDDKIGKRIAAKIIGYLN